jgi:ribosomal protein S18 acetylase RimI-like enzyme
MIPVGDRKNVTYFKRFKMELDLFDAPPLPVLPDGYFWLPWEDSLLDHHAEVMFASFHDEIDAAIFPNFGDRRGCQYLMAEIRYRAAFIRDATWLLGSPLGYCGTVQALRERAGIGAIQNLGVTPAHRGQGLGTALLLQALHGFRRAGLGRAFLEVTAQNEAAVRLYHRLGFRRKKTIYKAVGKGVESPFPSEPSVESQLQ